MERWIPAAQHFSVDLIPAPQDFQEGSMRRFTGSMRLMSGVLLFSTAVAWSQASAADPQAATLPAGKLVEYVGQYRGVVEPDVINAISLRDGALYAEGERMSTIE